MNKILEKIFMLNQVVRILATILKNSDVKNTAGGCVRPFYFFNVAHELISEIINTRY